MILPRKIFLDGSIQKEKVALCYRCKTRHLLDENCPKATPNPEDSGMSFIEQSGNPRENLALVEPESSADISGVPNIMSLTISQISGFFTRHNCKPFDYQWSYSLDPLDGCLQLSYLFNLLTIDTLYAYIHYMYKVLTCLRLSEAGKFLIPGDTFSCWRI